MDSLRLVKYGSASGEPVVYNDRLSGEDKYFRHFQISDEIYGGQRVVAAFCT